MGIWKGRYSGRSIGWNSPVRRPFTPNLVDLQDRGGLGWLAEFDEAIVRCGLDSTRAPGPDVVPNNMGVPTQVDLTLHGKIANLPAWRVEICRSTRRSRYARGARRSARGGAVLSTDGLLATADAGGV